MIEKKSFAASCYESTY